MSYRIVLAVVLLLVSPQFSKAEPPDETPPIVVSVLGQSFFSDDPIQVRKTAAALLKERQQKAEKMLEAIGKAKVSLNPNSGVPFRTSRDKAAAIKRWTAYADAVKAVQAAFDAKKYDAAAKLAKVLRSPDSAQEVGYAGWSGYGDAAVESDELTRLLVALDAENDPRLPADDTPPRPELPDLTAKDLREGASGYLPVLEMIAPLDGVNTLVAVEGSPTVYCLGHGGFGLQLEKGTRFRFVDPIKVHGTKRYTTRAGKVETVLMLEVILPKVKTDEEKQ